MASLLFISSREKRPRHEETEVEPSSDGLEFEAMAYDGFEAIREEEEGAIVPIVPLKIVEAIDDRNFSVKCSASGSTPSATQRPKPQVKSKRIKSKSISTRETRSKSVKPAANTRSKSKI